MAHHQHSEIIPTNDTKVPKLENIALHHLQKTYKDKPILVAQIRKNWPKDEIWLNTTDWTCRGCRITCAPTPSGTWTHLGYINTRNDHLDVTTITVRSKISHDGTINHHIFNYTNPNCFAELDNLLRKAATNSIYLNKLLHTRRRNKHRRKHHCPITSERKTP